MTSREVGLVRWAADGVLLNIKRFRLKEGADEGAFLAADDRLQREFTLKQPGMLECVTAKTTGGEWLVLHTWEVAEMGESPSAGNDPFLRAVTEDWMEFIDESTASSTPFERPKS